MTDQNDKMPADPFENCVIHQAKPGEVAKRLGEIVILTCAEDPTNVCLVWHDRMAAAYQVYSFHSFHDAIGKMADLDKPQP